ncbi:hypothetical protein [Sorangium sp. So ce388]|uniref:hypothetical protein n=1 Tax=Sorangium sp. So ce388 TaxID=3133309 RepID=UPI003F5C041A
MSQMGRHASAVPGLDLAVVGDRLQFFHGMAELFGFRGPDRPAEGADDSLEARPEQAQAEQAQAQAEQEQAEQAQAQAEQEQAEQAMAGLREAILAALFMRRVPGPDEARARLLACQDPVTLQRWLLRAMSAGSLDEILAE